MSNILGAMIFIACTAVMAFAALAGLLARCPACGSRDTANIDCTHMRCQQCAEVWER